MTKQKNKKQEEPAKYVVSFLVGEKIAKKSFPDFAASQKYMDARAKELEPNGVREPGRVKFWVTQAKIQPNDMGCESVTIYMSYTNDLDWWRGVMRKWTLPQLQRAYSDNANSLLWGDNYFKGSFEEWLQSDYGKELAQLYTEMERTDFATI